jgi:hypothetical protein
MIEQTLKKVDKRFLLYVQKGYQKNLNATMPYKLHSISTIVAVGLSINSISPLFYNGYDTFGNLFTVFRVVYALFLIVLYINAYYCWRVFFDFRKQGLTSDRNLFFSESANLLRKIIFYPALMFYTVQTFRSDVIPHNYRESVLKIRFATRTEFIQDAGGTFISNLLFAIVAVECIRLLYNKSCSWTNAKHFMITALITTVFSVTQLFFRYYFSGHGMFW